MLHVKKLLWKPVKSSAFISSYHRVKQTVGEDEGAWRKIALEDAEEPSRNLKESSGQSQSGDLQLNPL